MKPPAEPSILTTPDYSEASEFLVPASRRDLRTGMRLDAHCVRLLVRVMNHTYGKPKSTFRPESLSDPSFKRLLALGYVELDVPANLPHWAQQKGLLKEYRMTEKGALRLLDPESLIAYELMER